MDALKLAGGAVVAGIWKVTAVALAVLLLVVITGAGTELRAAIGIQNSAIKSMHDATVAADKRRRAAQELAAANGRRYDAVQAKLTDARANTCDEAMPYVDQLLNECSDTKKLTHN